jgi:hypothetical protein
MTISVPIYTWSRKAEVTALLDSGATNNFIDTHTVSKLRLGTQELSTPRLVRNVDGTSNCAGSITHVTNFVVYHGDKKKKMPFFITNLGHDRLILGHPWFKFFNPTINWTANHLENEDLVLETMSYFRRRRPQINSIAQKWAEKAITTKPPPLTDIPPEYQSHATVFSEKAAQRFPPAREDDHAINLRPDAPATINCKVYPLTPAEEEVTKEFIKEHLEKGYIVESNSPYASSFFFVKKKDGKLRPTQDYKPLNSWTIRDTYPLPLINTILEQLQGKKIFTKFDIRWGYNNIRIKKEDQWKAAFKTPFGLFQPRVMFFGLTNSPATFSRTMNRMFRHLKDKYPKELFIYMDDILIATHDDLSRHRQIVHEVLDLLEVESYFLKPSKCAFEQPRIEYLGIIVDGDQIKIDPVKADGLRDWPRDLKTLKEVRSTLGVLGYQRPFIPNFANIARPITSLLKKTTPFQWTPECHHALDTLISHILSDPALSQPDMSKPFQLEVDASAFATGAILSQKDSRGKSRAIGFHSKTFTEAERNYDIHDRELLAVVRGLENWRHLLAGSPHPITVLTDHKNLQYYRNPQRINRRVARYLPKLADYNFTLIHQPGTSNKADALSRRPDFYDGSADNDHITVLPPSLFINATISTSLDDRARAHQLKQPDLLSKWTLSHNLSLKDGFHWNGSRLVIVEDNNLRRGVISLYHDSLTAGHPGISKTLWAVSRDYWWPNMKLSVTNYIKGCATCQSCKNNPTNPKPPLFPITTDPNSLPFETIALDFITKLPMSSTYDTILTITDHDCSKASIFIPCNETIDAEKTALLYATYVLPHYGLPKRIISDRDPRFTSSFTKELCKLLQIDQNISTAYHPQTDGQSERTNQWLEQYLRIFTNFKQDNWASWLPLAQFTHNSWPSSTTKKTPFDLLMGHTPRVHQTFRFSTVPSVDQRMQQIKESRQQAQDAIRRSQNLMIKSHTRFTPYCVGDRVWLDAKNLHTTHPSAKLAPRRHGPFLVTSAISHTSYRLKLPPQWKIHNVFHASLLTPYKETPEHGPNFAEPSPDLIDGEPEWEVEQLLGSRRRRNQLQYLVRWKGFSEAHDSWEPSAHIHADQLVTNFHRQNPNSIRTLEDGHGVAPYLNPAFSPTPLIIRSLTITMSSPTTNDLPLASRIGSRVPSPAPTEGTFGIPPSPSGNTLSLADRIQSPTASPEPLPILPRTPNPLRSPSPFSQPGSPASSVDLGTTREELEDDVPHGFILYDSRRANHARYSFPITGLDGTPKRPHYLRYDYDTNSHNHYIIERRRDLGRTQDYGAPLLAAPFHGPPPPYPDNTDLSLFKSTHPDNAAVEIGLRVLDDMGINADVDRYRHLDTEHRELVERERDLQDAWNDWRRRAGVVRGRLVQSQARTRLHPYLMGEAHIPNPRYTDDAAASSGAPIREYLESLHPGGERYSRFPMPWLHDEERPGVSRWILSQGRESHVSEKKPLPNPAPVRPSSLTCTKCRVPNATHTRRNCPLWKQCFYCANVGHAAHLCAYPHSQCYTKDNCRVPPKHKNFKGGCDWHYKAWHSYYGNATNDGDYDYYEDVDWEAEDRGD